MKKRVSLLCTLAMMLSLVSIGSVTSVSAATYDGFEYTMSGGEATITKYNGWVANVVVPSTINGLTVTAIDASAFAENTALTSVTIPDTVITIRDEAFYNCTALSEVVLKDGLKTIGDYAFSSCPLLSKIDIPDTVTSIASYAFFECTGLSEVVLGTGLETIGDYAFYLCPMLKELTIPDSVTSMGRAVLAGCTGLKNVVLGTGLTAIADGSFSSCTSLTSIKIPYGVVSIGNYAFAGCDALHTAIIPVSMEKIGERPFYACSNFTTVIHYRGPNDNGQNIRWSNIEIDSYNYELSSASVYRSDIYYTIDTVEVPGVLEGDTVSIDIRTSAINDIACVELKVKFDGSAFEFVEGTTKGYLAAMDMNSIKLVDGYSYHDQIWITGMGDAQVGQEDEVIAQLTFKAKKPIVEDYAFFVPYIASSSSDNSPIALTFDGDEYPTAWIDGGIKIVALPGDINADGNVDMRDAFSVYRAASTGEVPVAVQAFADMNSDDNIDMRDAYAVYRVASGAS